ncbi:hypothetical protein GY45DRAFT_1315200 [Cubamyces sp. BRFM 1775]|nr:hypothetical protein GY45DRAFT_1315200 [Cubamyces sp. BRFM 1775]
MAVVSASVDAFLVAATTVVVSTALFLRRQPALLTLRNALTVIVVFNSLSVLYTIIVLWPPNIFQRLRIPLTTPSEMIRASLLQHAGLSPDTPLPKLLDALLTRLSSFDLRTLYVRFGQTVIQDCDHCTTSDDYLVFALPRMALGYVKEAAVLGAITIRGSGHERWRTWAVALIVGAFITESYWIATASIAIPRDGRNVFMWHDNLWLIRHIFFLALPILVHSLPRTPPKPDPIPLLASARAQLQQTQPQLMNARFVHAAIEREPTLRAAAAEWWERQHVEGEWAREDEHVRRAAEKLGRGIQDGVDGPAGRLHEKTKTAMNMIFNSLGWRMPQ